MADLFCTIFTPTYNRAELLNRLYNSLIIQSTKDFEWVIVDDGSTDNTEQIVSNFISENKITITYLKVNNGGKHRAINIGLEVCRGEVFAIVDSDDYLTENAIEKINKWFKEIEAAKEKKYCGIAGCKGYSDKKLIGETFKGNYVDATNIERKKYGILGDKFEVYYTEVLRQYKFPEYEDEKFMSEIVVWTRMAKDGYYIRWYQDIIYLCEYLEGGLTANNFKMLANSPKGYALRIREQVKYANISLKERWGYYSNYYFLMRKKRKFCEICAELEVSSIELLVAVGLRGMMLLKKGNYNEYKNI